MPLINSNTLNEWAMGIPQRARGLLADIKDAPRQIGLLFDPKFQKGLLDQRSVTDTFNKSKAEQLAMDLMTTTPAGGMALALKPGALDKARSALESVSRGEIPKTVDIATLTDKQLNDLNKYRTDRGMPPFTTKDVIYNGKHHYKSRTEKDKDSIDEMLKQIEMSMSDESRVINSTRGPVLQNDQLRIDQHGKLVNDRAVLEGGGERPVWLYSAFGRKKNPTPK